MTLRRTTTTTSHKKGINMTTTTEQPNALALIAKRENIALEVAMPIIEAFQPFYNAAMALAEDAKGITVTDATQLAEMKEARKVRLLMMKARTGGDAVRKEQKDVYVRMGRAIDGIQREIVAIAAPVEERLEEAEKFAERAEAARKAAVLAERTRALAPLAGVTMGMYDLEKMTDEQFVALCHRLTEENKAKALAERKAKAARMAEQAKQAEEEERLRAENEKLKAERAEQDRLAAVERQKQAEAMAAERRARAEEQRQYDAKLLAEQKARQAAEAERLRIEKETFAKIAAEELAKKKAAAAPDAEKLRAFAKALLAMPLPDVGCEDARLIAMQIDDSRKQLAAWIVDSAKTL